MGNLYKMLKSGGDMLLCFLASNPVFNIYEKMSENPKWKPYMSHIKRFLSPFHHSKDPEADMEKILSEIGFVSRFCRVQERTFTYRNLAVLKSKLLSFIILIYRNKMNFRVRNCYKSFHI